MNFTKSLLCALLLLSVLPLAATTLTPPNDSTHAAMDRAITMDRSILAMDYNSLGTMLAVAGQGTTVELIHPAQGTTIKALSGIHTDDILAVAFSPDDRLIATGGADQRVVIWDVASSRPLRVMDTHDEYISSLDWSPDGEILASSSWDGRVIFWEPGTGKLLRSTDAANGAVNGVAFDPQGRHFATAGADGIVRVYNMDNMSVITLLRGHKDDITALRWSNRSSLLATGSWDNTAQVWNPRNGSRVARLDGHTTDVNCLSFSPDGTILATSGGDRMLKLWDLPTGKEIANITEHAHDADVEDIVFNNSGTQLATCSRDGQVKIWNVPTLEVRLSAALQTGMDEWRVKGEFEKTADYEKRMKKSAQKADQIRRELENELAKFYEENVDWQSDMTFRTYNADREYFPLTSPLFGALKVEVSNNDAPLVAENLDNLVFENLNVRVRNGRMELRRFSARINGKGKSYTVSPF